MSRLWVAMLVLLLGACGGDPRAEGPRAEEPRAEEPRAEEPTGVTSESSTDPPVTPVTHDAGWEGAPLPFAAWVPPEATEEEPLPLLVALHGCCAPGMQPEELVPSALQEMVELREGASPFVVIEPLKEPALDDADVQRRVRRLVRAGRCDDPGPACVFQVLHASVRQGGESLCFTPSDIQGFLDFAIEAYPVDPDRVHLIGFSCGGFATWEYLAEHGNDQLASAVVLAGDGRPALAEGGCRMAEVPVWSFHGVQDIMVPIDGARVTVEALRRRCPDHAELKLVELASVGHPDVMSLVYQEPALWDWLLKHERPAN